MSPSADAKTSFVSMDEEVSSEANSQAPESSVKPCPLKERERLRIVVRDDSFSLMTGKKYRLEAGPDVFEGSTGEDGLVNHLISKQAVEATLAVWDDPEGEPFEWQISLRKLHPVATETGVQGRLHSLGFPCGDQGEEDSGRLLQAMQDFQALFCPATADDEEPSSESKPEISARLEEIFESLDQKLLDDDAAWTPDVYNPEQDPFAGRGN